MSRIYLCNTNIGEVGLYYRPHNADFPYMVTINRIPREECDYIGDAYRAYNRTIREISK